MSRQIRAREEQLARSRHEMEETQRKVRELNEVLAEREGQVKLLNMNLQTAQKQAKHHMQEVSGTNTPARTRGTKLCHIGSKWGQIWDLLKTTFCRCHDVLKMDL